MKYLMIFSLLFSTPLFARSECDQLYEHELARIAGKVDHETSVGGTLYENPLSGTVHYQPGIRMTSTGPNWARDFLTAINSGPDSILSKTKGKASDVLKGFSKALGKECKLKADYRHENLRKLLKSLMATNQFCPEGKILKPSLFGSYKKFHKIAVSALKDGDEFGLCDTLVVNDDSNRTVKEVKSSEPTRESSHSKAKKD